MPLIPATTSPHIPSLLLLSTIATTTVTAVTRIRTSLPAASPDHNNRPIPVPTTAKWLYEPKHEYQPGTASASPSRLENKHHAATASSSCFQPRTSTASAAKPRGSQRHAGAFVRPKIHPSMPVLRKIVQEKIVAEKTSTVAFSTETFPVSMVLEQTKEERQPLTAHETQAHELFIG